jgi:hypothetical protein
MSRRLQFSFRAKEEQAGKLLTEKSNTGVIEHVSALRLLPTGLTRSCEGANGTILLRVFAASRETPLLVLTGDLARI